MLDAEQHWSDSPLLLFGYLAVIIGGLALMFAFALAAVPLIAKVLVPTAYVLLVTAGTRLFRWAAFRLAVILILGAAVTLLFMRPIDASHCSGWDRPLSAAELARPGKSPGSTGAQLFTEQAGGNASAGFANWQRQGGQC